MFPYYGDIAELHEELRRSRKRLEHIYRDLLGAQLFGRLHEADRTLLDESSFLDLSFIRGRFPSVSTNNKFVVASKGLEDVYLELNGCFVSPPVEAANAFLLCREGFANARRQYEGWISPYLASYLHEYDHFVLYALQSVPMAVVGNILLADVTVPRLPLQPPDLYPTVMASEGDTEKKKATAFAVVWEYVIQEMYESTTRVLDSHVYRRLGCQVPDRYRTEPRKFVSLPFEELRLIVMLPVGDPLYGYSLRDRIRRAADWLNTLKPSHPIQAHFLESVRQMSISKVPWSQLDEDDELVM